MGMLRELTLSEIDFVAGGGDIVVTAYRSSPAFFGGGGGGSGRSGDASDRENFYDNIQSMLEAVDQWLVDVGVLPDPNEIVVTAEPPPRVNIGPGQEIAFYRDGIHQLFVNGHLAGNVRLTDGGTTATSSNNVNTTPPGVSDEAVFSSRLNYRFTNEP